MIIDTHTHAGTSWFEPVESLLFQMEANGVDRAVLIQHGGNYDNAYLLDRAAEPPGRFSVVGLVDESSPRAADTLGDWARQGIRGVRLGPSSPEPVWRAAADLGLTVSCRPDITAFASGRFADLATGLAAEIPIVIEHFVGAGPDMAEPYKELSGALQVAALPNVYVKLGGLGEISRRPRVLRPEFRFDDTPAFVEMILEAFGPQRTMWGSDYPPVGNREGYRNALVGIAEHPALSDPQDRDQVLATTALSVFRFD